MIQEVRNQPCEWLTDSVFPAPLEKHYKTRLEVIDKIHSPLSGNDDGLTHTFFHHGCIRVLCDGK